MNNYHLPTPNVVELDDYIHTQLKKYIFFYNVKIQLIKSISFSDMYQLHILRGRSHLYYSKSYHFFLLDKLIH